MQVFTGNLEVATATGKNVRTLINELDRSYPGIKDVLVQDDRLRPGLAIMLDGTISPLGLLQPLSEDSEVTFIPAIHGG